MGMGTSLFLIAVGAILAFAIHLTGNTSGVDIHTIGWILMIVGAVGALLSVAFWSSWGGFGGYRRQRTVIEQPGRDIVEDRRF
jgi:Domain of unknown function (DUF6458)